MDRPPSRWPIWSALRGTPSSNEAVSGSAGSKRMEVYERTSSLRPAGVLATACTQRGTMRNTGSPSGDRGMDQLATRERQAGRLGCTNRSACSVPSDGARESMVSCKGWEEKNAGEYGSVEENRAGVECGPGIPGEELSSKDIGDLELRVLV